MCNLRSSFAALIIVCIVSGTSAYAQLILPGTTDPIPIPATNPGSPTAVFPSPPLLIDPNVPSYSQTWSFPAKPDWIGTFTFTGAFPSGSSNPAGTTTYDFTGLPLGFLPVNSFLRIGDLDHGSGNTEKITISGTCVSCGNPGAFLDLPFGVSESIFDFIPTLNEMPSVIRTDPIAPSSVYEFIGSTVIANNPGISFAMTNNHALTSLTVVRADSFSNFSILAMPIPEPSTFALAALGLMGIGWRRRNRA